MKTHTNAYKNQIKLLGRQIDSKITYTLNSEEIELGPENLNSITPSFKGALLKSVMKELEIDSNVEIPLGTEINYQFGLKVGNTYEYLDFGNYIVNKVEKQEDTYSYIITAYDKMLYSMVDYEDIGVSYPITIKNYISALCTKLGLTFANASETFCNYDKEIQNELFLSTDGTSLDYTFRDVLDQLAEVTGSIICINSDDELELRYIDFEDKEPGKNMLNTKNYIVGKLNTNTGELIEDEYSAVFTDFIPVELDTYYTFSADWSMDGLDIYRYDENYEYLSGSRASGSKRTFRFRSTNQSEKKVKYIKLGFCDGYDEMSDQLISDAQLMMELGSDRTTPYEPYVELNDTIDAEYLKDINVKFGEKFGPVNSIVLSRAGGSDNIYLQDEDSIEENGLCEIKIEDNQFMNFNDRDQYLPDLLETLDGLEFYLNDYSSTGVTYLELCDMYNVSIDETTYKCVMLNDTIEVNRGLSEDIYTEQPDKAETDYKKADKTDRRINQAYIIVDKQNQEIEALTSRVETLGDGYTKEEINQLIQNATEGVTNNFINSGGNNLLRNTGLWFEDRSEIEYMYPHSALYPDNDLYMSADPHWEYWKGNAKKVKEDKASNMSGILLQTGYLEQQQQLRNGTYTLSFKYRKLIELANVNIQVNDRYIYLTETSDTEVVEVGDITSQTFNIKIFSDTDDSCVIYDLMLNAGSEKAEYSQHQNETTTDTVNISKGITISSSDTNTTFKANSDGIRVYNSQDMDNPVTEYTDVGMDTNRINVEEEAQIIKVLWKEVGNNTWISRL